MKSLDGAGYTELFAEQYLGSIFCFCLKKTGSRTDAEELSGDIILTVLDSLAKYPPPEHFSAWVWAIARRRYARWAKSKRIQREKFVLAADTDDDEPASDEVVEEHLLESETYSLLHRELAFIAREYRDLLVTHYIKEVGISTLSTDTGIPVGTIKTRLYKARKILKEGMDMAREFGKRSYNPESIRFCATGNQPDGLPWLAVQRKAPMNILLEASNNPSTAEELSMELGIALPYMEEEIAILERATLLKAVDDKYVTNFFIADKEIQLQIYTAQRHNSKERARLLAEAVEANYTRIFKMVNLSCSETDFRWFLYIWLSDCMINSLDRYKIMACFERPNGGDWGFCGYEKHHLISEETMVNHNICGDARIAEFGQYAVFRYGFRNRVGGMLTQINLFAEIVTSDRAIDSLMPSERKLLDELVGTYAHIEANRLIPDIVVMPKITADAIKKLVLDHPAGRQLHENLLGLFHEVREILKQSSNAVLHQTLDYYVSLFLCDSRSILLADEVDAGILRVPEDKEKSIAGTYMFIQ